MIKALLGVLALLGVVAVLSQIDFSAVDGDATEVSFDPRLDTAALETMMGEYHRALREGRWGDAASFYEPGSFEAMGVVDPAGLLKMMAQLTEIPEDARLVAIRIEGDRASGEVVIDREGFGDYLYLSDEEGKRVGTHARTVNFVRIGDGWKIAADSRQTFKLPENLTLPEGLNLPEGLLNQIPSGSVPRP